MLNRIVWHIFFQQTHRYIQVKYVQNLIAFCLKFWCQRVFLWLRHVFEQTDTAAVKIFSVRPFSLLAKFFARNSNPFKKSEFFVQARFGIALRVSLYVCNVHSNVNVQADSRSDLFLLICASLNGQVRVMVDLLVGHLSKLDKSDLVLAH